MISVIVPVYNAEKYIEKCINSILNQTYKDLEIIAVNDGSTDGSFSILEALTKKDNRLKLINKENSGVSDTRNIGLNNATGDYIGFVDADDFLEDSMYEKMICTIGEYKADICCCGYRQEYADYYYDIATEKINELQGPNEILSYYLRQDIRSGIGDGNWNKLFKKELLTNIRYKKYANGEDIDFQFRAFLEAERMVCIPDILYHYVANDESATGSEFNVKKASILKVASDILDEVLSKYTILSEEAYAFYLTWNLSLLQKITESRKTEESKKYARIIRENLSKNKNYLINNKYSKRLDQFYLKASLLGIMKPAMLFRKVVRTVKPSKDKKIS